MNKLRVIAGDGQKPERSATPFDRLRQANEAFHEALKLDKLEFHDQRVLSRCLDSFVIPTDIPTEAIVKAIADPEKSLLRDFEEAERSLRTRWHALLARLGTDPAAKQRHEGIKQRLGFILRVIKYAKKP